MRDFVLGGYCLLGILAGGYCPGGFCPGGIYPDTPCHIALSHDLPYIVVCCVPSHQVVDVHRIFLPHSVSPVLGLHKDLTEGKST